MVRACRQERRGLQSGEERWLEARLGIYPRKDRGGSQSHRTRPHGYFRSRRNGYPQTHRPGQSRRRPDLLRTHRHGRQNRRRIPRRNHFRSHLPYNRNPRRDLPLLHRAPPRRSPLRIRQPQGQERRSCAAPYSRCVGAPLAAASRAAVSNPRSCREQSWKSPLRKRRNRRNKEIKFETNKINDP
jgi:hypothetical protein